MNRKLKLGIWECACFIWIALAGSMLHFAFELSNYWEPIAVFAAVNESAWEHAKMYFWPGLVWAIVQYTYSRGYANNYWLGKAIALAATPTIIFIAYFGYMGAIGSIGIEPSLALMIGIMLFGIAAGQFISYKILSAEPLTMPTARYAALTYAALIAMFTTFTYMPPETAVFENFFCYEYTGEYGILENYDDYRVFPDISESGQATQGGGINYCAGKVQAQVGSNDAAYRTAINL